MFYQGKRIRKGPITLVYNLGTESEKSNLKLLVSVPKRNFKRAVDRNLLKRRIREAFRLNETPIDVPKNKTLYIGLIYTYRDIREFNDLQKTINLTLRSLNKHLSEQGIGHEKN